MLRLTLLIFLQSLSWRLAACIAKCSPLLGSPFAPDCAVLAGKLAFGWPEDLYQDMSTEDGSALRIWTQFESDQKPCVFFVASHLRDSVHFTLQIPLLLLMNIPCGLFITCDANLHMI